MLRSKSVTDVKAVLLGEQQSAARIRQRFIEIQSASGNADRITLERRQFFKGKIIFESLEKTPPGIFVTLPEAVVYRGIERRAGCTRTYHGKAAQNPQQAEKYAVAYLGEGYHQGVIGIEYITEHIFHLF